MKRLKKMIPRLCFVAAIAIVIAVVYVRGTGGDVYDFSHLTPRANVTEIQPFEPLAYTHVPNMLAAAQTEFLVLYVSQADASIAVYDRRNSHVWHSNPLNRQSDPIANQFEENIMRSKLGFHYFNEDRNTATYWSYRDSAALEQAELFSIPNGVRVSFTMGTTSLGIRGVPDIISEERLYDLVMSQIEDEYDRAFLRQQFVRMRQRPGYVRKSNNLEQSNVARREVVRMFEEAGYTFEDLLYDNEAAGLELDISLDVFHLYMDFMLEGDSLIVNLPISQVESERDNLLRGLDIMRYFGAGSADEEGYIFVPSGSGALIEFNNGKTNHEPFMGVVYGVDPLNSMFVPQETHDIRLPVFGIAKEDAAILATVVNGSALTMINADISGRVSSFNTAWFGFTLRESDSASVAAFEWESSMTIIQESAYDGDITVRYFFLAGDDANYQGMARAYQNYLVDNGVLTPLTSTGDVPFYLSILGAIEKQEFVLGTPYFATVPMTTYRQGAQIIEMLNAHGIYAIQTQWMGWFNRGANHDVATGISPVRQVGSTNDRDNLIALLEAGDGGFYPAVRFQSVRRDSRGFNTSREAAQDLLGYLGVYASVNREMLRRSDPTFRSDIYVLVHPGVLPFHVDSFIPAFTNQGINALALADLGDTVTQSTHRRNGIDRESARLIAAEQLARLHDQWDNIMISGGNDYSLFAARHLVDVPTQAARFYILDHSIPFVQMVLRGFVEYSSTPINTRDSFDGTEILLNMLATGTAPHFMWTYQPMEFMSFTQYQRYYSTHYQLWYETAIEMYQIFNEVFAGLRTTPMTDFEILCPGTPGSIGWHSVTVSQFGSTRVYVNASNQPFEAGSVTIPAQGFWVERN